MRRTVVVLVLIGALAPVCADAARLPTKAQASKLLRAFAHDKRHGRKAQALEIKVSTVDSKFARIVANVPGKARAAAKGRTKTVDLDYRDGEAFSSAPPSKVGRDLAAPIVLTVAFDGTGHEHGTEDGMESDGCTQASAMLDANLSWTTNYRVDLDNDVAYMFNERTGKVTGSFYEMKPSSPFRGTFAETYGLTETPCGGGDPTHVSCSRTDQVVPSSDLLSVRASGIALDVPFVPQLARACTTPSGSSAAADDFYTARWPRAIAAIATSEVGLSPSLGNFSGYGKTPVSFPRDEAETDPDRDGTTSDPRFCQLGPAKSGCSDTLSWSGTIEVEVPR